MMRALWSSASGMQAEQTNMDIIANNLANVNTAGFKRSRVEFQDMLYQTVTAAGSSSSSGQSVAAGLQVGHGTHAVAVHKVFSQGNFQQTGNPLDLVIEGEGFFQVSQPDGSIAYTRSGSFSLNAEGQMVTADGSKLIPDIVVPPNSISVNVGKDGTVSVLQDGQNETTEVGKIELANFANPSGLMALGQNLYRPTAASGDAVTGTPGQEGLGQTSQGFLELSNVSVVEEMVNMIVGQRAYEASSKAVRTSDEMLAMTNHLKD
jgi:flagellar basal-body rod protein FlgG